MHLLLKNMCLNIQFRLRNERKWQPRIWRWNTASFESRNSSCHSNKTLRVDYVNAAKKNEKRSSVYEASGWRQVGSEV